MSKLMTAFSKNKTFVGFLGESNSVKFKLNATAISKHSILNGYVYINDQEVTRNLVDGLNVFKITNNILVEQKTFTVTTSDSTNAANAFVSYLSNAQTDSYYLIVSGSNLAYTSIVANWLASVGSTCYPINALCSSKYASGYVALYNSRKKSIVNESAMTSDRATLDRATLEVVYDDLDDQGSTGFPRKVIYDSNEYTGTSDTEFVKYPLSGNSNKLSDYGISGGDTVSFTGEIFGNSELINNGMVTRASIRFYQGSTLVTVVDVDLPKDKKDVYYKFEKRIDLPQGVDTYAVSVQRYNNSGTGTSKVRNITLSEVSISSTKNKIAMFGVNGLKASNFTESAVVSPELVTLYDNNFTNLNTNEMVEEDFYLPDYYIRTSVGTGHIPYEAEVDRSGPGYYYNRDNLLTYAEYNEARIDWKDNRAKGILVEQEATNLFAYSNDFSKMSSYTTKTGKFGSLDLWNLRSSGNVNVGLEGLRNTPITTTKYVIQFIVRKNTGGKIMFGTKITDLSNISFYTRFVGDIGNPNLTSSGNSNLKYKVNSLGNDYWLYQITYLPSSNAKTVTPIISCGSSNTSDSIDLVIVQLEANLPTSFILTQDQSVTRPKDIGSFNLSSISGNYSVLYKYINQDNPDVTVIDIIDYSNTVPPFVSPNFKSGWVVETSVFKRVLTDQEKNNIKGG